MQKPRRIQTVHVEELENELCIYDWQRKEVHNLNPTAALVWELCDGQTTPQQMAQRLQAASDLDETQAEDVVWMTLEELEQAHLLESEVVQPAGGSHMSRRTLLKQMGVAAALLPVVVTIVAPGPAQAQTPGVPPDGETIGTWRPLADGCGTGDPFDNLTLTLGQINADADVLCVGSIAVEDVELVANCAECAARADALGADWYRFGLIEGGFNCATVICAN